jgi:hypothetical protein
VAKEQCVISAPVLSRSRHQIPWFNAGSRYRAQGFESADLAETIEAGPQENSRVEALFVAFFEPIRGLIRITESYIDHGNLQTMRVNRVSSLLQITQ